MNNRLNVKNILLDDELSFIRRNNLDISDFCDARGLSKSDWRHLAKLNNKLYIIGSPCRNANHRLRTRSGHCIQCDTSKIKYIKRFHTSGILYIAKNLNLYKVGIVENNTGDDNFSISNRQGSLNGEGGYGGIRGWEIVKTFNIKNKVGRVEDEISKKLATYNKKISYIHSGEDQDAKEIYECDYETILEAVEFVLNKFQV